METKDPRGGYHGKGGRHKLPEGEAKVQINASIKSKIVKHYGGRYELRKLIEKVITENYDKTKQITV